MTGLVVTSLRLPCDEARVGEPDAGNLHVRFDEGEQLALLPTRHVKTWVRFSATVKTVNCRLDIHKSRFSYNTYASPRMTTLAPKRPAISFTGEMVPNNVFIGS